MTKNDAKEHSLTIKFTEPDDIELWNKLSVDAKNDRRQLSQYALLVLHAAVMPAKVEATEAK